MRSFEIKGKKNLVPWVSVNIVGVFFIITHVVFFFPASKWYFSHILSGEAIFVGICLLALSDKRERNLYKVSFDDEHKIFYAWYYLFYVIKVKRTIAYEKLHYMIGLSSYKRRIFPETIRFLKDGYFIVELRKKYNIGWTDEEINEIEEYLKSNKLIKNDSKV